MVKVGATIPLICTYLNNLDIHFIVVTDLQLGQEAGGYSKQAFTIQAISDAPVEVTIY
jgi:hypothetical protein